jgi:hypothetical protein
VTEQVALYGLPFTDASRATLQMVRSAGLQPLVSCWLMQAVCGLGAVTAAGLGAAVGVGLALALQLDEAVHLWLVGLLSFAMGLGLAAPLAELPNAVVTAVLVCYARDASFLERRRPDAFAAVQASYEMFCRDEPADDDGESEGGSDDGAPYDYEYDDDEAAPDKHGP